MILFPALDIHNGRCVRMRHDDREVREPLALSAADEAKRLESLGCQWIHIRDINGVQTGSQENREAIKAVIDAVNIPVEISGGMRDLDTLAYWREAGAERLILGPWALNHPKFLKEAAKSWPGHIGQLLDAQDGYVLAEKWRTPGRFKALDLALELEQLGICAVFYRDTDEVGGMGELNIEAVGDLAFALAIPVIALGGVDSLAELQNLKREGQNCIAGIVCGQPLYDGRIDIEAALKLLADPDLFPCSKDEA